MSRKLTIINKHIVLSLMLITCSSVALETGDVTTQQQNIENIEIVGSKPLSFYRQQMEQTELKFYDTLNDLVAHPKYKMKCKKIPVHEGSRITQKACYPQYFLAKKTQLTEIAVRANINMPSDAYVEFMLKKEKAESLAHVEELVKKNPELKQRLVEMFQAKQAYLSKKEAKKD